MLYPAVSELEKVTKSRYALVIMTAKRARQISEKYDAGQDEPLEKPVKMAINDIAAGKVAIKDTDNAEPQETAEE